MPPSLAASVVGKFGFLCTTLFGKIGRSCTGPLRERQYASHDNVSLSIALRRSLQLMLRLVEVSPPRTINLDMQQRPYLLYTDASHVPEREHRFVVGAVLIFPPPHRRIEYLSYVVPPEVVASWLPKQTYMGQLEILAGPLALSTWKDVLQHSGVIHFVDNDAAAAGLVKGYSSKRDSTLLISSYWSLAAEHAIDPYLDRVESKSNLSDGPSRLDHQLMHELQAVQVKPDPAFLFDFPSGDTAASAPAVSLVVHNSSRGEREANQEPRESPLPSPMLIE